MLNFWYWFYRLNVNVLENIDNPTTFWAFIVILLVVLADKFIGVGVGVDVGVDVDGALITIGIVEPFTYILYAVIGEPPLAAGGVQYIITS